VCEPPASSERAAGLAEHAANPTSTNTSSHTPRPDGAGKMKRSIVLAAVSFFVAQVASQSCDWGNKAPPSHANVTAGEAANEGHPWLSFRFGSVQQVNGITPKACIRFTELAQAGTMATFLRPAETAFLSATDGQSFTTVAADREPGPAGLHWSMVLDADHRGSEVLLDIIPTLDTASTSATVAAAWAWRASLTGRHVMTMQSAWPPSWGVDASSNGQEQTIGAHFTPSLPGHGPGTLWPQLADATHLGFMFRALVARSSDASLLREAVSPGPGATPVARIVAATRVAEAAARAAEAAGGADAVTAPAGAGGAARVRPDHMIAALSSARDDSLPATCRGRAGPIHPRAPAAGRSSRAALARGWEAPLQVAEFREQLFGAADRADACSRVGVVVGGAAMGPRLWDTALSQWAEAWYIAHVSGATSARGSEEEAAARFHGPRAGRWKATSAQAAASIADASVDLVMLAEESGRAEIRGWWRTIRDGGTLAGPQGSMAEAVALSRATGARLGTTFGDSTATWFLRK